MPLAKRGVRSVADSTKRLRLDKNINDGLRIALLWWKMPTCLRRVLLVKIPSPVLQASGMDLSGDVSYRLGPYSFCHCVGPHGGRRGLGGGDREGAFKWNSQTHIG